MRLLLIGLIFITIPTFHVIAQNHAGSVNEISTYSSPPDSHGNLRTLPDDESIRKTAKVEKVKLDSSGAMHGQIIPDPLSPSKMVYNKDDNHDGQLDPVFLCGAGDPEGFLYRGTRNPDGTRNGDQMELIQKLIEYGGNSIYFLSVRTHGGDGRKDNKENPQTYPDDLHNPWIDQDPKKGFNDKILDQWETWFTEMDENNIIIYFFIYDDAIEVAKRFGWALEDNGELNSDEREFVQGLVNRFKHHRNLIWCVMEEGQEIGENWQQHISKIAEAIDQADDHNHIIASHQLAGNVFFHKDDQVINQFAIQTHKNQVETPDDLHVWLLKAYENSEQQYSLVMAEDFVHGNRSVPNGDRVEVRLRNWAAAMAGCYIMVYGIDIANTPQTMLKDCRILQTFFESTSFNQMSPNDLLASGETAYVLANEGFDYILYSANVKNTLGVKGMSGGTYSLTWLDCTDGAKTVTTNVPLEAGDHGWEKPSKFGNEVALYVYREDRRPEIRRREDLITCSGKGEKSINTAPLVENYAVEVSINTPKDIQLRYMDEDGGPGPYSIKIISEPEHGTLSGVGNDKIYTPDKDYVGDDRFSWRVNDGKDDSNVGEITITIN